MWPRRLRKLSVVKFQKDRRPTTVGKQGLPSCSYNRALLTNLFIRKWLGVPHCLRSAALYGKDILELPLSSLAEEFKCAMARLKMTLTQSKDPVVKSVVLQLTEE